jgi:hypothetical protein
MAYIGRGLQDADAPADGTVTNAKISSGNFVTDFTDTVITASDEILFADATDTQAEKKDNIQGILDLVPDNTPSISDNGSSGGMVISSAHEITMPLQPCFHAYINSTQNNVTGNGTSYDVTGAIWTETFDQNADFSNGTFTAPVSGRYLLQGVLHLNGIASCTDFTVKMVTSNKTFQAYRIDLAAVGASSGITIVSFGFVADMDSADTAKINIQGYNVGSDTVDVTATNSLFMGCLLA